MPELVHLLATLLAAGLLPAALALPTPQMSYGEQSVPEGGVTSPVPTVTSPTGSLYGPDSLRGEIAQPSPISGGDSAIVSDYPLVSGQEADADLGLFLDFNSVENPQPIRGTLGQTDPGPRKYSPCTTWGPLVH
jgi:hypothetical protein